MIGDISLSKGQLSGTLSRSSGLAGTLALGVSPGKYYTKAEIDEMIESLSGKIVSAETYLEFPVVGNADAIYIDTANNKVYRWDDDELKYFCIGSDYDGIGIINGSWDE